MFFQEFYFFRAQSDVFKKLLNPNKPQNSSFTVCTGAMYRSNIFNLFFCSFFLNIDLRKRFITIDFSLVRAQRD